MNDIYGSMMIDQTASLAFNGRTFVPKAGTKEAIEEAAEEFEAVFAAQMLQPMFDDIQKSGLFGGGHGEKVFMSMMVQEFGRQIAGRGELGIAEAMTAELLRIQEEQGGLPTESSVKAAQEEALQ